MWRKVAARMGKGGRRKLLSRPVFNPEEISMLRSILGAALASVSLAALAQVPAGYPADYAKVLAAAKKEGKVVIYSALATKAAQPLAKHFTPIYPATNAHPTAITPTPLYTP